jgi:hypothetical protein
MSTLRLLRAVLLALLAYGIGSSAVAEARSEKIKRLMEAQGLLQMFEQQQDMGRVQLRQQADDMLEAMLKVNQPARPFMDRLRASYDELIAALQPRWSPQEFVDVWAHHFGSHFTEAELDQLIAHYHSPLGRKEVQANQKALGPFTMHFAQKYGPVMEQAMTAYAERVQGILRECDCRKMTAGR